MTEFYVKSRVSPEIVFGDYDCCYLFSARNPAEFHSRWRFIQSKGCGIIDSVKKLGSLLAIALPFASAVSVGKARAQTFPGVSTTNVARLGFVSQASTATDPSLVAKGKTRYADYKCDECHGANGEGGGDGPDLIGTRLNADEISKFLEKPSPDAYMKGMPNIPAESGSASGPAIYSSERGAAKKRSAGWSQTVRG
jgi:mono/diheme cytochrome c family protein